MSTNATRIFVSAYELDRSDVDEAEYGVPSPDDAGLFVNRLDEWQTRKPGLVLPRRGLDLARRLRGAGVQIDDAHLRYRHLEGPGRWTVLGADVDDALAEALQCCS